MNSLTKAAKHANSLGCPSACWPLDASAMKIKPYHNIGPLQPDDGHAPGFAQLYVHDPRGQLTKDKSVTENPNKLARAYRAGSASE